MNKVAAYFKYLYFLPSVPISALSPDAQACPICLSPYNTAPWTHTYTAHHAVKLACGHTFGIQCLAEWAFSPNFNNACPYCQKPLITSKHQSRNQGTEMVLKALQLRRVFDIRFRSRREAESFKKLMAETCDGNGIMTTSEAQDRMMIIFDEYFKTGEDPTELAPISWRELEWWSIERNEFTEVMFVLICALLFVAVLAGIASWMLYPLVKVLVRRIL